MAEEEKVCPPQETEPGAAGRSSRRQQRRRQKSVMQYIVVLFAAAFVLLLITFMMERRQFEQQQQENQASIDDLKQQSVSTVQTLKGMTEENAQLKEETEQLQKKLAELEKQLEGERKEQEALQDQLRLQEETVQAMAWFWELNDAYVRGRLGTCRELIASMEEAGLVELLPAENITETDHLSPAARYQEIHDRVIK